MDVKNYPEINSLPVIKSPKGISDARRQKLAKSAKNLEAIFISYMIKSMEKTIPENPVMGSGNNLGKMMFSSVMGQAIADQGGFGLAEMITESFGEKKENLLKELNPMVDIHLIHNQQTLESVDE